MLKVRLVNGGYTYHMDLRDDVKCHPAKCVVEIFFRMYKDPPTIALIKPDAKIVKCHYAFAVRPFLKRIKEALMEGQLDDEL